MEIFYQVGERKGKIVWAASEYFGELEGKTYNLGEMEAVMIAKMTELSLTAQLLLSAVAGAVIQHLIDQGVVVEEIFNYGTFTIGQDA